MNKLYEPKGCPTPGACSAAGEIARLRAENERLRGFCWNRDRGPEDDGHRCTDCSGSGVRIYGSTATWLGGIGGRAMTPGVCDGCWGSGYMDRKGLNLKLAMGWKRAADGVRREHGAKEGE